MAHAHSRSDRYPGHASSKGSRIRRQCLPALTASPTLRPKLIRYWRPASRCYASIELRGLRQSVPGPACMPRSALWSVAVSATVIAAKKKHRGEGATTLKETVYVGLVV